MAYKDKAQQVQAANAYNREKYDRVTVMLPKGERERLRVAAEAHGESLSEYIKKAIADRADREIKEG